jgi:hypothetical protein
MCHLSTFTKIWISLHWNKSKVRPRTLLREPLKSPYTDQPFWRSEDVLISYSYTSSCPILLLFWIKIIVGPSSQSATPPLCNYQCTSCTPPPQGFNTFTTWPINLRAKLRHAFTQVGIQDRQVITSYLNTCQDIRLHFDTCSLETTSSG